MDAVSYLREDMRITHEWLEATMQDVTQEQLDWHPPGTPRSTPATCIVPEYTSGPCVRWHY